MATDNNHLGWPEEGSLAGVHAPHQLLAGLPVTAHIPEWKRGSRAHADYLKPAHVHNRPATSPYTSTSTYMYDGVHCLSSSHLSRGCDWSVPLLARRDLQLQPRLQADLALMEASWWWAEIVCTRSMKQATLITPRPCRRGRNSRGRETGRDIILLFFTVLLWGFCSLAPGAFSGSPAGSSVSVRKAPSSG